MQQIYGMLNEKFGHGIDEVFQIEFVSPHPVPSCISSTRRFLTNG